MVSKSYMLEKKRPPSELRLVIDQRLIPAAIDVAGAIEAALERVAVRARQQPATAVGAALTGAATLAIVTRRLLRPRFL